jgi:Uma2 family endonuclease
MSDPAPRRARYEDLLALPANVVGEILDGTLHAQPRPAPAHARASSRLGFEVGGPFDRGKGGPGGWVILDAPELHLGDDIVVPDLAGCRRARMPELPKTPYFALAPDWVCEVLSPSTARLDRTVKRGVYAREGVPFVWFVDAEAQTLEVLVLDGATYRVMHVFGGDERVRAEPFDAIELELGALWET